MIDVSRDAPVDGSYPGVDPDGLLTTMRPIGRRVRGRRPFVPASRDSFLVKFDILAAERVVTTTVISRILMDPEVTIRPFDLAGESIGMVWQPSPDRLRHPRVLVLAPPGTSMAWHAPGLLASRGYLTLRIAQSAGRFGLGGPFTGPQRVSTTRMGEILAAIGAQLGTSAGIVLLGVAEWAEPALHTAADQPELGAVIAYLSADRVGPLSLPRRPVSAAESVRGRSPVDHTDSRHLIIAADGRQIQLPGPPARSVGGGRNGRRGSRWLAAGGGSPTHGPGRLPGDAVGSRAERPGAKAWDLVLDLLRELSISDAAETNEAQTVSVNSSWPELPGPDRHAR